MNDAQLDVFHFEFLTPLKWETSGPEKKIMEVLWTHFVVGWWSSKFVQRCPHCPSRLPSNFTRKQLSKNVLRRMLRPIVGYRYRHKTNVNSHYIPSMLGTQRHATFWQQLQCTKAAQPQFDTQTLLFTFDRLMPETTRPVEKKQLGDKEHLYVQNKLVRPNCT